MNTDFDYLLKFIWIGNSGVGKTSLHVRFTEDTFGAQHPLYGSCLVNYGTKIIKINKTKYKLQLWDIAGQERFGTVNPLHYRGTAGIMVVFDLGMSSSFREIPWWIEQCQKHGPGAKLILIGNKSDLEQTVSDDEIQKLVTTYQIPFFKTSARNGTGVTEAMTALVKICGKKIDQDIRENKKRAKTDHMCVLL
jgi:small GTP-binding protein